MVTTKAEIFRKAALKLQKAQTELANAKTAQKLVDIGVLSPTDVRKRLVRDG